MKNQLFYKKCEISKMPIISYHLKITCHILAFKYKLTLEGRGGWGANSPCSRKSTYWLLTPQKLIYSCPLVSTRNWFQGRPWTPNSTDAQVLYMKWCRAMDTVSPPHIQIPTVDRKYAYIYQGCLIHKKYFICGSKIPETHLMEEQPGHPSLESC